MNKYLLALLTLFLLPAPAPASAYGKVSSGNSLYKKNAYDQSLDRYREAQIAAPENPVVHFNIGDALHKTGNYDEAGTEYSKALNSKDKLLRSKAYYNLGNNAFAMEKSEEALEFYKKALSLNPRDMDAKYNIEYLLNRKNQPKDKKGGKNDKNDKEGKDKEDKSAQGSGDKDKKDKGGSQKNEMSKEDAQRILQYYNDQEKNSAQKRKMKNPELPKTEQDW